MIAILRDILYKVSLVEVHGLTEIEVNKICFDSREVESGSLFIALRGTKSDGHQFITSCISKGAVAVVCEEMPKEFSEHVTYVKVNDSAKALAIISANFYDNPSEKIKLIGITGTNGKTTTATLLFRLFRNLNQHAGLISTVQNQIDEEIIPATNTTPDPVALNRLLALMVAEGCTHCFMEVSSHAIVQKRTEALKFSGGVFTNITHDHLDYHRTFKDYIAAKKLFFDMLPETAFALVNVDDRNGSVMIQNCKAKKQTYALKTMADYRAKVLENNLSGLILNIDNQELHTQLIGEFNAYNILAVYAVTRLLGVEVLDALTAISKLQAAEGRFDFITSHQKKVIGIVDYAHTPDALQKVLETIRNIRTGNEMVITVVGCGGDRDKTKRPIMAKIACELSDKVILTSDNPRSENPQIILSEMEAGVGADKRKKVLTIADRKEAIRAACTMANAGDIVLVAGKGHEKYQEIAGVKYPFDDKQVLTESFNVLEK